MIELAYPWLLCLIVLPLLVYWLFPTYKEQKDSLQVPYFQRLVRVSGEQPKKGAVKLTRGVLQRILLAIGWLALILAVAKPEWVGEPIEQKKSAREVMFALDLSGSMAEQDFTDQSGNKISRLEAAKAVLNEFASRRQHDRLGLILFADAPYLQAPFTQDIATWQQLLNQTKLGYAGFKTTFGDAIGLAIKIFQQDSNKQRVLILLTDGEDTGSAMPPAKAAEIAAQNDIKIYTIAVGDPSSKGDYKMDIKTLEKVASVTGGKNFQALNKEELSKAYDTIDKLEKELYEAASYRPRTSLHHWTIGIYFVINLLVAILFLMAKLARGKQALSIAESKAETADEMNEVDRV
ncbi:vWA domain-containing protein [Thalassomonas sp. M1454]|uniref:vWA domain-containing protein n=1 Tax=Thalassomonas sp. M1454 TaxID=2594477 RepID=UPI00117C67F4|nr:VWA domain-containing protein [Thalassomonas sp. M1454]TRX56493.1 VWA domain-containing protein [Thalassomonas sp. M1454]